MKSMQFLMALMLVLTGKLIAQVPNAKTVIILDASNSMWGVINGKTKIEMAKEALNNVVSDWDETKLGELGITVYGHRSKKDCNDIESIIPVGPVNKEMMINAVKKIQPTGMTPISKTIEIEAAKFKDSDAIVTFILVSDGIDSCNADPCKTVNNLVKQGINFKLPVVGFNVDEHTNKQLECIAKATDSKYFTSNDMESLTKAIAEVIKPMPSVTLSTIINGEYVPASYTFFSMNKNGEADKKIDVNCQTVKDNACSLDLPKGDYVVITQYNGKKGDTTFTITVDKALNDSDTKKVSISL